jgi:hypothetical protein
MKWRFVGLTATVTLLLVPSPLDVVRCEPARNPEPSPTALYEFVHSFKQVIAAGREIDRRLRLCGDPSMTPVSNVFAANGGDAVPSGPPR